MEWFYSSKGEALAAILCARPLVEAATADSVRCNPAFWTPLPQETPTLVMTKYTAKRRICQTKHADLIDSPAAAPNEAGESPILTALLLLQEVGKAHLKEISGLLQAVASFALPVVTQSILRESGGPSFSKRRRAEAALAVLSSLVADCRRLIDERLETSITAYLIGKLCCIVVHPLMLRAECRIAELLEIPGESTRGREVATAADPLSKERVLFSFTFSRDLLAQGATSLAISRAVVCKVLHSFPYSVLESRSSSACTISDPSPHTSLYYADKRRVYRCS